MVVVVTTTTTTTTTTTKNKKIVIGRLLPIDPLDKQELSLSFLLC